MTENPFAERYRSTETSELLEIVSSADEYEATAVETAQFEIESRKLTQEQLADAIAKQLLRRKDQADKQQQFGRILATVQSASASVVENLSPIQAGPTTTARDINGIVIFICVLFLYQVYREFNMLWFLMTYGDVRWDASVIFYLFPLIILPVTAWLLWKRKTAGWMIAMIYGSYVALQAHPSMTFFRRHLPQAIS